jgi:hypothetical protein
MEKKTAIIDLDSILFAAAWGNKIIIDNDIEGNPIYQRDELGRLIYQDKTEDQIKVSLDSIMIDILDNIDCKNYVAFVKGKNTSKHRYAIKHDYKGNRPKESPSWWAFTKQYAIDGWKATEVDNIEVDDAVNITAWNTKYPIVVSIDKDLLNLKGLNYNWKTKEFIPVTEDEESKHFWIDMIVGQPGDNIAGLPNKGKVFANKVFKDVTHTESFRNLTFQIYIDVYGEFKGIEEFYKNYNCLKILDNYEGFVIPDFIEYNKTDKIIKMLEEIESGGRESRK